MKKIGFAIFEDFPRPDAGLVSVISRYSTPQISDGLNKFNTMTPRIKPIIETAKICGPALTVRLRPGDNLMLHKVADYIRPGDVVVVDTCECATNSVMGELMVTAMFQAGAAGIVVDGGIRDILELKNAGFSVFAAFVTPSVGDKDGPGEINGIISCGGVAVRPGDLILGDANGVVVIPREIAQQVAESAAVKSQYEEQRIEEIKKGVLVKADVNSQLRAKGIID